MWSSRGTFVVAIALHRRLQFVNGRWTDAAAHTQREVRRTHRHSSLTLASSCSLAHDSLPTLSPEPAKATSASVTTLASGLTVVTEGSSSTSTVSLTFPKAGSSNEALGEQGAALLNKCLAFRSGSGMSTLLINRTIEDAGGVPTVHTDRTKTVLGYSVTPENATRLVPLLATDCAFERWDVRDARGHAEVEIHAAYESAQVVLTENLFAAAYGPQSPAGRPLYSSTGISTDAIASFRDRAYGINGAVLTATGIRDHGAFCTEVAELLSGAPSGASAPPAAPVTYLGGESRVAAAGSGYAHVALAFPSPASAVLASVVKQLWNLAGMSTGVAGFVGGGTVGVYSGSASPGSIVDAMVAVLTAAPSPNLIKRAKSLAKAEALFALDGGSQALASAMTAAVLESGTFSGPGAVAKAYDAITDSQVKEAVATMLKSNPSLAAVGDITSVPYHATVASLLK
jgi:predicted Zn-dependent peptidase